jgi:hypothetical protein
MKINKIELGELEKVYATCIMDLNDQIHYIVASEGPGECRAINAKTMEESVVWDAPGGTMNIIPVPGRKNEFIATQKFLPTFNAEESQIVHAVLNENNIWSITPIMTIPYLHRFDLFLIDGELNFIGGILCNSKAFIDDWSDPGKIVVGKLHEDIRKPFELKSIYEGITKNHGFFSTLWNDRKAFFITGVEGAFIAYPPVSKGGEWDVEQLFDHEISDCAICDIDGDGSPEIATIELFHGDIGKIYKEIDGKWQVIHEHTHEFGHVVWGGLIRNKPAFIIGARKGSMETVLFTFKEGKIVETLIDNVGGPSNISVINHEEIDMILAANRQIGKYCIYEISE